MNAHDKQIFIDCYTERYQQFAYDPRTLGWGKGGRQAIRFGALLNVAPTRNGSVLDIGCGFGDLFGFMKQVGWQGKYVGVDIVPVLIDEALRQHPAIDARLCDVMQNPPVERFDYVVASGIFNRRMQGESHDAYLEAMLATMFRLAQVAVAADFMSTHVDYQNEYAYHADPCRLLALAMTHSRRAALRHDYLPFEFCVYLYKDAHVSPSSTFVTA